MARPMPPRSSTGPSRRLEVVAGDAHGTALLVGPNGAKVQATIIDFLSKHDQAS